MARLGVSCAPTPARQAPHGRTPALPLPPGVLCVPTPALLVLLGAPHGRTPALLVLLGAPHDRMRRHPAPPPCRRRPPRAQARRPGRAAPGPLRPAR
ncbi:hypothetical protein AB0D32_08615, partial [Micromonospora sp. NPDC048170]|uniref:hypothetical protein n=1 Tax=Micromonospora sp. NPDC048170 TaxID=3154819 RepID=UPI0033C2005C